MKKFGLIILLGILGFSSHGQTIKSLGYNTTNGEVVYSGTNVLTFTNAPAFTDAATVRTNLGLGATWLTNTVAADFRSALGLGGTDDVEFRRLKMTSTGDGATNPTLWLAAEGTNKAGLLRFTGTGGSGEAYNAYLNHGAGGFNVATTTGFRVLSGPQPGSGSVLFGVSGGSGNVTMNGSANTAPNQTAASGSSIMTRDLSDARYSFSRWYTGYELLALDDSSSGVKSLSAGIVSGGLFNNYMVAIPDINTKFNLPVDWRASTVKVVSYWTDRGATNAGGTNADIAVWSAPHAIDVTNNTARGNSTVGTGVTNSFTANYGGTARVYVVEQTLDFSTVSGISFTNPLQPKFVELQRRASDAADTSTNTIWLSAIHIYIP